MDRLSTDMDALGADMDRLSTDMDALGAERGESGGAASLWVVLMVPIAAFAASVAMAGPQRLAAESSMKETADDLATLAVAWRDGQQAPQGEVSGFPLDCAPSDQDLADLAYLASLDDTAAVVALQARVDDFEASCREFHDALVRDLGRLGVDMGSLRGSYSDALTTATAGGKVPCIWSPTLEVREAVHVALAADWKDAGWAAAQVWPDGVRLGSESIGRITRNTATRENDERELCTDALEVFDERGRLRWVAGDDSSRAFTESVAARSSFN